MFCSSYWVVDQAYPDVFRDVRNILLITGSSINQLGALVVLHYSDFFLKVPEPFPLIELSWLASIRHGGQEHLLRLSRTERIDMRVSKNCLIFRIPVRVLRGRWACET